MRNITIINQYSGNKGDRAVCYFLLMELIKIENLNIILSTNERDNWKNESIIVNNNIKLVPWGWNVENFNPNNRIHWEKRRFFRTLGLPYVLSRLNKNKSGLGFARFFVNKEFKNAIKDSDLILSTGGHHLTTRFTPNCHNELLFDLCSASLINQNLILWSQTYGPFKFTSQNNKNGVIKILKNARCVFVRDIKSFDVLHELIGAKISTKKTYESVIGLNSLISNYVIPSKRENIVGITIYNAESRTVKEYQQYCQTIAEIIDWLSVEGYKVKLFPHEIKGAVVDDRKCIIDILNYVSDKQNIFVEHEDLTTEEHLNELSKCKFFIGHKTHSVIFALTVGTPLIPISYHPKTTDFLIEYELEENIINDTELDLDKFKLVFNSINSNVDIIGAKQFEKSQFFAKKLKADLIKELDN